MHPRHLNNRIRNRRAKVVRDIDQLDILVFSCREIRESVTMRRKRKSRSPFFVDVDKCRRRREHSSCLRSSHSMEETVQLTPKNNSSLRLTQRLNVSNILQTNQFSHSYPHGNDDQSKASLIKKPCPTKVFFNHLMDIPIIDKWDSPFDHSTVMNTPRHRTVQLITIQSVSFFCQSRS